MIPRKKNTFVKNAVWVSHTALNDFLNCPKAYYLKNIYRDPKTGNRIQITSPFLTLGMVVHETLKWYLQTLNTPSILKPEEEFRTLWRQYRGKKGGFTSLEEEAEFGKRGLLMLENFLKNFPNLDKPRSLPFMPKYPLAEDIILTGNMDYVGEQKDGSLHVIDFKTGSKDEDDPIQLYIYAILAENFFGLDVEKASYWYLDRGDSPKEVVLDPLEPKIDYLLEKGQEMKKAIEENNWMCFKGETPCYDCRDYIAILGGKGELLYSDKDHKKDVYFLKKASL